jgi:hypothetical protein
MCAATTNVRCRKQIGSYSRLFRLISELLEDPGLATNKDDYALETYVLSTNHYQIELLTNLDQVPEAVALVVVGFPKSKRLIRFSRVGICDRAIRRANEPSVPRRNYSS